MARASTSERLWLALAAVSAGALAWLLAEPLDLRKDHSFEISEDPNAKVIEVNYIGGRARTILSYEIFGDGRLVCTRGPYPPQTESTREILFEERLARSELLAIFGDLARSGVLEADWNVMRERFRPKRYPSGLGGTLITLRLTRYRQRVAGPSGPVRFQIADARLLFSIREYPEVRELAALGRLVDRLEIIRRSWPRG